MKFINFIFYLFFITEISCLSRGLYLGKEKCFYDNYFEQSNIVLTFKIIDKDIKLTKLNKSLFLITISGMEKGHFQFFHGSKLHGKFAYTIEESDKYKVCIYSSDKELFKNKNFLHMEFKVQPQEDLYDEHSAKAKDFQKVNNTMQKINTFIDSIESIQNYQLEIEDTFAQNQVKSSSRMVYITLSQIVIICIVGIYHVYKLRKIFKDKIWAPF